MPGWMKPSKRAVGDLDTSEKGKAIAKSLERSMDRSKRMSDRYAPKTATRNNDKKLPGGYIEKGVRP